MGTDLKSRYAALHREMVEQFERTAAVENHWLMFTLLGWEHLAACALSHYLLEVQSIQLRWPYVVLWLCQIFVAVGVIKFFAGKPRIEESPLEPINKRIWTVFIFLCISVAVLNVVNGRPVFVFLPALAVLSSFAFTMMTSLVSRKFMFAGLAMFVTGILTAKYPAYGFLIYGAGWLAVLEVMAVIFFLKRLAVLNSWQAPSPDS